MPRREGEGETNIVLARLAGREILCPGLDYGVKIKFGKMHFKLVLLTSALLQFLKKKFFFAYFSKKQSRACLYAVFVTTRANIN